MPSTKKKRFSVVYRRSTHDKRTYGLNKYVPHFLDIFYATKGRPDRETLKGIRVSSTGRYRYTPSLEYIRFKRLHGRKEDINFTTKFTDMYIAKQDFTSVHGRFYKRGQEINWFKYQLLASLDKKKFFKWYEWAKEQSKPEEDYRQELQERDGEATWPKKERDLDNWQPGAQRTPFPLGDAWTPDEDIMHFPRQQETVQDLGDQQGGHILIDIDSSQDSQSSSQDIDLLPGLDDGPTYDQTPDSPADSTSNTSSYESSGSDSSYSDSSPSDSTSSSSSYSSSDN